MYKQVPAKGKQIRQKKEMEGKCTTRCIGLFFSVFKFRFYPFVFHNESAITYVFIRSFLPYSICEHKRVII